MDFSKLIKFLLLFGTIQILTPDFADAGLYCRSPKKYRGKYVFYDVSKVNKRLCGNSQIRYIKKRTRGRMFHVANTGNSNRGTQGFQTSSFATKAILRTVPNSTSGTAPASTFGGGSVSNFMDLFRTNSPLRATRTTRRQKISVYQWPSFNVNGQEQSVCGSQLLPTYVKNKRRRPPRYMQATSACMIAGVAQEWRQKFCPDNDPSCQLLIGDMSWGRKKPGYWPHGGHNRGNCIDIFPIRKPGYKGYTGNVTRSRSYDRKRTLELIKLLKKYGGGPNDHQGSNDPIFNDPNIVRAGYTMNRGAHYGHIHVCFKSNNVNKKRCEKLRFDSKLCPSLSPQTPSRERSVTVGV